MAVWDYPEPEESDEDRHSRFKREYDPDFEYEEARTRRDEEG